jgi:Cu/Ag efflux protein CusF
MTRKFFTSFSVAAGMLALAVAGQAQNFPSSPGKSDMPSAPMETKSTAKRASGEVTMVDAKSGKLGVRTGTEELNLDVPGSAKNSLADIKIGDKVNISFEDKGGMLVANSVNKSSGSSKSMESTDRGNVGTPSKIR